MEAACDEPGATSTSYLKTQRSIGAGDSANVFSGVELVYSRNSASNEGRVLKPQKGQDGHNAPLMF